MTRLQQGALLPARPSDRTRALRDQPPTQTRRLLRPREDRAAGRPESPGGGKLPRSARGPRIDGQEAPAIQGQPPRRALPALYATSGPKPPTGSLPASRNRPALARTTRAGPAPRAALSPRQGEPLASRRRGLPIARLGRRRRRLQGDPRSAAEAECRRGSFPHPAALRRPRPASPHALQSGRNFPRRRLRRLFFAPRRSGIAHRGRRTHGGPTGRRPLCSGKLERPAGPSRRSSSRAPARSGGNAPKRAGLRMGVPAPAAPGH